MHVRRPIRKGAGRFGQGFDDYEEELRAFSRKRQWEREKEKRTCVSPSSSDDEESKSPGSQPRKKRFKKQKTRNKGTLPEDSDGMCLCM